MLDKTRLSVVSTQVLEACSGEEREGGGVGDCGGGVLQAEVGGALNTAGECSRLWGCVVLTKGASQYEISPHLGT